MLLEKTCVNIYSEEFSLVGSKLPSFAELQSCKATTEGPCHDDDDDEEEEEEDGSDGDDEDGVNCDRHLNELFKKRWFSYFIEKGFPFNKWQSNYKNL